MRGAKLAHAAGLGADDRHRWRQPPQPWAKALDERSCHQPRARGRGPRRVALL